MRRGIARVGGGGGGVRLPGDHNRSRGVLWISMRALEKDRNRRYGSPDDLADDIRRHLRDEPVSAGPPDLGYRARKFARRHRVGVAVAVSSVAMLLAFAVTMTLQARRIARERDRAVANELTSLGRNEVEGDPSAAAAFALASLEIQDQPAARELIGQALARGPLRWEFPRIEAFNTLDVTVVRREKEKTGWKVVWGSERASESAEK